MQPKSDNTTAGIEAEFSPYEGVQRLSLPAGQELIYRGHIAPGVFMFLSGCVRSGARVWRSDDNHRPFLIPEASALDSPFPESVTIEEHATALFIPRSVVLRERSLQQLLELIGSGWMGPKIAQESAAPVAKDASRDSLRIHKLSTLHGNGDVSIRRTVHCKRRGGTVAIADCLLCDYCDRFVWEDDGEPSELTCDFTRVVTDDLVGTTDLWLEAIHEDRVSVSTIMTSDVICVKKDLSLEALTTLFVERGFSGAPVVNEKGFPIGLVSKTDLVRERYNDEGLGERDSLWACGSRGVESELEPGFHTVSIARATVADIMMPVVFAVPENASIEKAAALMAFEGVHRVPVVSSAGQIVGILSSLDIISWLAERTGWLVGRSGSGKNWT